MFIFTSESENGKRSTLEQLFLEYRFLMLKTAFEVLNDQNLAEDAVQSAFLKLTKNSFTIDEIFSNKTRNLMIIVAKNAAIDIFNKRKKDNTIPIDDELMTFDDNQLPLELVVNTEYITKVQKTLTQLESKYADVILLKYYIGYSSSKIAKLLGKSEGNVWIRMHRAKKMLAEKLSKEEVNNEE